MMIDGNEVISYYEVYSVIGEVYVPNRKHLYRIMKTGNGSIITKYRSSINGYATEWSELNFEPIMEYIDKILKEYD